MSTSSPSLINILMGRDEPGRSQARAARIPRELERDLPDYRRRLAVRPGLTGLAQVQQPPDMDLFSVRRKLNYDLYYVERISPWLDFRLILGTVLKCLGVPFAWIGRLLQLPDPLNWRRPGSVFCRSPSSLPAHLRPIPVCSKSLRSTVSHTMRTGS